MNVDGSSRGDNSGPTKGAVRLFGVSLIIIFLSFCLALAGSYGLTLMTINNNNQAQQRAQQMASQMAMRQQITNAVPTCRAIVGMDDASHGAVFAGSVGNSYGRKLAASIHSVVVSTKCDILLADVAAHKSITQIQKDMTRK